VLLLQVIQSDQLQLLPTLQPSTDNNYNYYKYNYKQLQQLLQSLLVLLLLVIHSDQLQFLPTLQPSTDNNYNYYYYNYKQLQQLLLLQSLLPLLLLLRLQTTTTTTTSTTSALCRINEVTLRRARLVLGWATVYGQVTISVRSQPARSTQPSTLCGMVNRVTFLRATAVPAGTAESAY